MKRRDFLKVTGIGAAGAVTLAAPAIAQSMPEIEWRFTTSWPKSLDTLYGAAELMAKTVGEITDLVCTEAWLRRWRNQGWRAAA